MAQRPKDLHPERGGWHLWGAQLRSLRERAGHTSGPSLARVIQCHPSLVSKYETASRVPPPDQVARLDEALRANGTLIDLAASITAADEAAGTDAGHGKTGGHEGFNDDDEGPLVPVLAADGRTVHVSTSRRDLLKGLGAVAGLAATGMLPAVASFDSGAGLLDHFGQMRSTLADNDNLFGAHRVIPVAREQLDRMHTFNSSLTQESALRRSFQIQTEFADLLGWLHEDSGDYASSQYWIGRALDFAHMSGDPNNVSFVLSRKSQLAGDMSDAGTAVLSARAAVSMAANPRLGAIAATQLGHAHALAGDEGASAAAYDEARRLLASHDGDDYVWGQYFTTEYINVFGAHSRAALGDHVAAVAGYQAAITALPTGFRRDQAVYLAHQARALADGGDHDAGAALGQQALILNAETGSARGLRELTRLGESVGDIDTATTRDFLGALAHIQANQSEGRQA